MASERDRMRKIHGISEPTGPAEQAVLARRELHESAAEWLAKRSYLLQIAFAAIGLVVVLLPVFFRGWRMTIEGAPIVRGIFHHYSTFSGMALVNLYVLAALFLARSWQGKSLPRGAHTILTYRDVVDMELYPRTRREELAYWTDISFGLAATTLWLLLPFGVLAYFIRIAG